MTEPKVTRTLESEPKRIQKTALAITRWLGSPASIVVHTVLFAASFVLVFLGFVEFERMLLVVTTVVSLEAIYLSLFIQMSINYNTDTIVEVEKDIDEIQEDIDEMQEDVEEIQEDVDELQEDIEDISEDVGEDEANDQRREKALADIESNLRKLMEDISKLQR